MPDMRIGDVWDLAGERLVVVGFAEELYRLSPSWLVQLRTSDGQVRSVSAAEFAALARIVEAGDGVKLEEFSR